MSFLENVIRNTARIEERLDRLGGQGSGLYELATTIRPRLSADILSRLQSIGSVRNKLAHEPDYHFDGDETEFLGMCDAVLADLGAPLSSQQMPIQSPKTMDANRTNSANKWVEFKNASWGDSYASSPERRVVHLLGTTPVRVLPNGVHDVPFVLWRDFDRVAIVIMGPRRAAFDLSGKTVTKDGIAFQGEFSLQLSVLDSQNAVQTIALLADEQEQLIRDRVLASIQAVARLHTYETLDTGREQMVSEVLAEFAENRADGCAFKVDAVFLTTLEPHDPEVRGTRLKAAQATERDKHATTEVQRRVAQAKLEAEAKLEEAKGQIEVEALKKQHELAIQKKLADQELAIEKDKTSHKIDTLREMAKLLNTEAGQMANNMDKMLEYKIRLKEIEKDLEVAKDRQHIETLKLALRETEAQLRGEFRATNKFVSVALGNKLETNTNFTVTDVQSTAEIPDSKIKGGPESAEPCDEPEATK